MPFVRNPLENMSRGIAYSLKNYCKLVDTTGRCIRDDKAGHIDNTHSPILERFCLHSAQWLTLTTEFYIHFCYGAGSEQLIKALNGNTHRQRPRGMTKARELLKRA